MNIYKIFQSENNDYDTFDSAIVAAESEEEARDMDPKSEWGNDPLKVNWNCNSRRSSWAFNREKVNVEYIGVAKEDTKAGIILASFNAG